MESKRVFFVASLAGDGGSCHVSQLFFVDGIKLDTYFALHNFGRTSPRWLVFFFEGILTKWPKNILYIYIRKNDIYT